MFWILMLEMKNDFVVIHQCQETGLGVEVAQGIFFGRHDGDIDAVKSRGGINGVVCAFHEMVNNAIRATTQGASRFHRTSCR